MLINFFLMEVSIEKIKEIAQDLGMGFKVFFNTKSQEIISFPDPNQFSEPDSVWQEDIDKVHTHPKHYLEMEKMDSSESYSVMEDFIETVKDKDISNQLLQAIEGHKPFANFRYEIAKLSATREAWFDFQENQMLEYIRKQLNPEDL